jgi:signal transduction histidine kinase
MIGVPGYDSTLPPGDFAIGLARIRVRGETEALVTVRDAGIGFHPQNVEQIFEAFHTTKPGGLGMGLSISRSIVESHGGRLWAIANEVSGATFQFTLSTHSSGYES